jgi:hypothetical protein
LHPPLLSGLRWWQAIQKLIERFKVFRRARIVVVAAWNNEELFWLIRGVK